MPEKKTRTIRIFEEDYQKIASEGKFGESHAEVVHRMLEGYRPGDRWINTETGESFEYKREK